MAEGGHTGILGGGPQALPCERTVNKHLVITFHDLQFWVH